MATPPPHRWIGQVEQDGRVRDAFAEESRPLPVAGPIPPGSWGLFEARGGRARLEGPLLASGGSARADLYALAARHRIHPLHPETALAEARSLVASPGIDDPRLLDLTHLPFATIDEEDTRDLDQALFIERRAEGYTVWYAIADAAWSIRTGTALFDEALRRGATYYLPGLVFPMLPIELSEGVVSLNPAVPRRARVFRVSLDENGRVAENRMLRARIRSRLKTSFDAVQAFLDGAAPCPGDGDRRLAESLELLRRVGTLRMALAEAQDVVRIRRSEIEVSLASRRGLRFVAMADPRNDVEQYNEQVSLLCNVEGARFLRRGESAHRHVQPIYRVHEPPSRDRLDLLFEQIEALIRVHALDPRRWRWRRDRSLAGYLRSLPEAGPQARIAKAVHRQAMLSAGSSGFRTVPGVHHGVGATVYSRFTAPMREVVGVFVHKETWEKLRGAPYPAPAGVPDDEHLRELVVSAANRSRQIQRELDHQANRLVLDQIFEIDLEHPRADRRVHRATVLGITRSKVHAQFDDPPIDVKLYLRHLEAQRGGERLRRGPDGATVRRVADGEIVWAVGDEAGIRAVARDETRDRWELELVGLASGSAPGERCVHRPRGAHSQRC
jgi:ribonuclease R